MRGARLRGGNNIAGGDWRYRVGNDLCWGSVVLLAVWHAGDWRRLRTGVAWRAGLCLGVAVGFGAGVSLCVGGVAGLDGGGFVGLGGGDVGCVGASVVGVGDAGAGGVCVFGVVDNGIGVGI